MNRKKDDRTKVADFFHEEAAEALGIVENGVLSSEISRELNFSTPQKKLPSLPKVEPAPEEELKVFWRNLRAFFRSGKEGKLF
jgi:hypothetical protein